MSGKTMYCKTSGGGGQVHRKASGGVGQVHGRVRGRGGQVHCKASGGGDMCASVKGTRAFLFCHKALAVTRWATSAKEQVWHGHYHMLQAEKGGPGCCRCS